MSRYIHSVEPNYLMGTLNTYLSFLFCRSWKMNNDIFTLLNKILEVRGVRTWKWNMFIWMTAWPKILYVYQPTDAIAETLLYRGFRSFVKSKCKKVYFQNTVKRRLDHTTNGIELSQWIYYCWKVTRWWDSKLDNAQASLVLMTNPTTEG